MPYLGESGVKLSHPSITKVINNQTECKDNLIDKKVATYTEAIACYDKFAFYSIICLTSLL